MQNKKVGMQPVLARQVWVTLLSHQQAQCCPSLHTGCLGPAETRSCLCRDTGPRSAPHGCAPPGRVLAALAFCGTGAGWGAGHACWVQGLDWVQRSGWVQGTGAECRFGCRARRLGAGGTAAGVLSCAVQSCASLILSKPCHGHQAMPCQQCHATVCQLSHAMPCQAMPGMPCQLSHAVPF